MLGLILLLPLDATVPGVFSSPPDRIINTDEVESVCNQTKTNDCHIMPLFRESDLAVTQISSKRSRKLNVDNSSGMKIVYVF